MLTPEEIDELATRLVSGSQEKMVAELFEQLVSALASDGALTVKNLRLLETAANMNRRALLGILARYRTSISGEVRAAIADALDAADAADVEVLSRVYPGVKVAGQTAVFARIAEETADGVVKIIARDNLKMVAAAERLWYRVSTDAIASFNQGAMTPDRIISRAVRTLAREGLTVIDYASGVRSNVDVAVRRHVVSQAGQAAGRMTAKRMAMYDHDLVRVSAHFGARPDHAEWQGGVYSLTGASKEYRSLESATGYGTVTGLLGVNCVVGETLVSGPAPRAGYRHEYTGELVVISTAGGKQLTVTPNHPILTSKGWVAAGLLNEGDDVVCGTGRGQKRRGSPDVDDAPTAIQEVFRALCDRGDVLRLAGSSVDFHGDIPDSEVEVVLIDGLLDDELHAAFIKQIGKGGFGNRARPACTLFALSSPYKVVARAGHATHRIVRRFRELLSFVRAHALKTCPHRIAAALGRVPTFDKALADDHVPRPHAQSDLVLGDAGFVEAHDLGVIERQTPGSGCGLHADVVQSGLDDLPADTELVRDGLLTHPELTELDYVVRADRVEASVHVYNLETSGGWYFANGIVSHNCRHSFGPYYEGITEFEDVPETQGGMTSDEYYEATQKQREHERGIRETKRDIAALERAGASTSVLRAKLGAEQRRLKAFTDDKGLVRQPFREKAYGIGVQPIALRRTG